MKKSRLHVVKMNNYTKIDTQVLLTQSTRWLTNGPDNSYFYTVERAYLGSPTNQAIIDNYTNYIIGEGIEDKTGLIDVTSYLSEEDQRLAIADFKIHGACAFQVIYKMDGSISKLYYVPTKCLAVNKEPDVTDEPTGYWYSFDWQLRTRFKPEFYPAFGCGDKTQTEILYIKRHSPQPIFALPDWQSGIQYCQTEEELSNYYVNHIKNNFSAGKIVNINQGIPADDEAQEEAERAIKTQLTGTSNAGHIIISFNENKDNATTVDTIEINDAYSQFQFLSEECKTNIMLAHKVNDRILFGLPTPSGFSSAADQMVQALKMLYRSQINPSRRIILNGLSRAFETINPACKLHFVDFEELRVQDQTNPVIQQKMAANKVSFDFDGTANTRKGSDLIDNLIAQGVDVYIISARQDNAELLDFASKHGILSSRVYATGSNTAKVQKVLDLNIDTHYDNNQNVIDQLPGIGKNINSI
jgi:hypothetical protein